MPESLGSKFLAPIRAVPFATPEPGSGSGSGSGSVKDTALVGKRKPLLSSMTDQARITQHIDAYWRMENEFRQDPALPPD